MGYTHGTQWTLDKIHAGIREVASALEIDRMPTMSEVEQHFKNSCLTNAISRTKGWYALAQEMGLPIKDSETYFGKRYEAIAMEMLISKGFEVRRMPQNFPYDLLVNDCVKIDVKAGMLYKGPNGHFYSFHLEKPFATCDIYILYLLGPDKSIKNVLIVPSKFVPTNKQISVGEKTSRYYKYGDRWDYIEEYCAFMESIS